MYVRTERPKPLVHGCLVRCEELVDEIEDKAKIKVDRDPETISDAAAEFQDELKGIYKTKAPAKSGTVLNEATDAEHAAAKHLQYQKLVGLLTWITQVKVETCTIVSMLGQRMAKWCRQQLPC